MCRTLAFLLRGQAALNSCTFHAFPRWGTEAAITGSPRKRVWVQAHRGFKSHPHRELHRISISSSEGRAQGLPRLAPWGKGPSL